MNYDQYTRTKGETYVLEEDITRDGFRRPVVIEMNRGRGRKGDGYQWRSYRSDYWNRHEDPDFKNYVGYMPDWYRRFRKHEVIRQAEKWKQRKLLVVTALVSPILFAKLPLVLSLLFQP